ncbi:DUF433 domain-containing protein [Nocardia sp. R16R-3T]
MDSSVFHGRRVIRGLRDPIVHRFDLRVSGISEGEILSDYPDFEAEDFRAVVDIGHSRARRAGFTRRELSRLNRGPAPMRAAVAGVRQRAEWVSVEPGSVSASSGMTSTCDSQKWFRFERPHTNLERTKRTLRNRKCCATRVVRTQG